MVAECASRVDGTGGERRRASGALATAGDDWYWGYGDGGYMWASIVRTSAVPEAGC